MKNTALYRLERSTALRYFLGVAEAGSFRAASERMHIASSAISRQISHLEDDIGVKLFERHRGRGGLQVTEAGKILLARLHRVTNELRIATSEIDALQHLQRGHVILGSNEGISDTLVPSAIGGFWKKFPNITYDIRVGGSQELVTLLNDDAIDFAVGFNIPRNLGFEIMHEVVCRVYVMMNQGHPLANREVITAKDLAGVDLILPDESLIWRTQIDMSMRHSEILPKIVAVSNSMQLIISLVRRGVGVSFIGGRGTRFAKILGLVYVPYEDPVLAENPLRVCKLPGRNISIAAMSLADEFANCLQQIET
ncbi:LysR family transcriptional regulator [Paracoccus sp. SY]|uniref:LysR family transcriptional regulator n=1 Tax=Paracoccus sp. SY TaxID=1330255 RepID=UPI000CD21525|nr:LysR family transcriptional regulator [Paracoccus sp. SY]